MQDFLKIVRMSKNFQKITVILSEILFWHNFYGYVEK